MATLVSTGQITIVDNNDGKNISAVISASGGTQQVYDNLESTITYTPSWYTGGTPGSNVLTPSVYIGGYTEAEVWSKLINRKFSLTQGGTAITAGTTSTSFVNNIDGALTNPYATANMTDNSTSKSTLTITGNLKSAVGTITIFFEADFVEFGLTTKVVCQITLNTLKTGAAATFVQVRGNNVIEEATGQTKTKVAIAADLYRGSLIDSDATLIYKWYRLVGGVETQITTADSASFGLSYTAGGTIPAVGTLGTNLPASGAGTAANVGNTLTIDETGVVDIGIFKVTTTGVDNITYSAYFTVYDISDPYDTQVISSIGDKFINGVGTTTISAKVYYGTAGAEISNYTGWTFNWTLYDKNGKRAGFVDTTKIDPSSTTGTAQLGGAAITSNTTTTISYTYTGTNPVTVGSEVKCTTAAGDAYFYEVDAVSGTSPNYTLTVRLTGIVGTWPSLTDFPQPIASQFVNGKLLVCTANGTRSTSGASNGFTLTGYDIDVRGRITCESNRP